jgi:hypothetical protein
MNDRFWTRFFLFCGIYNVLIVGLPMVLAPSFIAATSGIVLPATDWLFVRMAGIMIATFGVGYFMVASDLDRHRSIVVIGVVGKVAVALLFTIYWLNGTIAFRAFLTGFSDLIFVAFFWRFLSRYAAR